MILESYEVVPLPSGLKMYGFSLLGTLASLYASNFRGSNSSVFSLLGFFFFFLFGDMPLPYIYSLGISYIVSSWYPIKVEVYVPFSLVSVYLNAADAPYFISSCSTLV